MPIELLGQTRIISGIVVDGKDPLPGAIVVIKGTAKGTQTDLDGKFSLEIPGGKDVVLLFSYMCPYEERKIKENDSYIRLNFKFKEKRLYFLAGASLMNSENSDVLAGTTALGYQYHYYRFGIGAEVSLLPIMDISSVNYQLGLPVYGSIKIIPRVKGIVGVGHYWALSSNTVRNDFKVLGGLLYRRNSVELDIRYFHGTSTKSESSKINSKNLNLGIRFYIW